VAVATRKEQKAQLRAQREAREREALARARRRRRLYRLGGILALAAIVVAVAIVVSQSGSGSKHEGGAAAARAVRSDLAGIPQSDTSLGSPKALVTVTEYADLQCPVCRTFALDTLPTLTARDVKQRRVRLVFRNLQTATPDAQTFTTEAVAALAAGRQNRLWNYVELFYRNQGQEGSGYVTPGFLTALAKSIPGLDMARWNRDRQDKALAAHVSTDASAPRQLGFNATPSLLIQGPKFPARKIEGAARYSQLERDIQAVQR
jgi:protein-disulfide isomerase